MLSALTTDIHSLFQYFSYTPWTYSYKNPLTDVAYAGDTVLTARTQETLSRLLHLLHLAVRIGLLLNGPECQLLCIHVSLPILLSTTTSPYQECDCPFCAPCDHSTPNEAALAEPLPVLSSAEYLGSFILLPPPPPPSRMLTSDALRPLRPSKR